MNNIYDIHIKDSSNKEVSMSKFEGKTLLIVNVASKCGLTPQYKGLQSLYEEYKDRNFVVLGFPCNQFGGQEPGTNSEINNFCASGFSRSTAVLPVAVSMHESLVEVSLSTVILLKEQFTALTRISCSKSFLHITSEVISVSYTHLTLPTKSTV